MMALLLGAQACAAGTVRADQTAAARLVSEILSIDGDSAYGEYLGGECVTCHQISGAASGIPPIVGHPQEYTVEALVEYKLGIRANEVMKLMTAGLTNEEIAALAAYFASIEPK